MPPKTRPTIAAIISLAIFILIIAVVPNLMPGPLKRMDYMVIGTLATLAALLAAFLFTMKGWFRPVDDTSEKSQSGDPL